MKNFIITLKDKLCRLHLHWWIENKEGDERKCDWCSKEQEIQDTFYGPMGAIDRIWKDKNPLS